LPVRTASVLALLLGLAGCSSSAVSGRRCGGNTTNSPGPCPAGYSCVNDSGIPSGDVGGVCQKND